MKVTLKVNGKNMTFSERELVAILEEHFQRIAKMERNREKFVEKPTTGKPFEVNHLDIDQKLFEEERDDYQQEWVRRTILEAFSEVKKNPTRYGKNFKTLRPRRNTEDISFRELKSLASKLGDHNADWVEQALEWAQRIANGERWVSLCNMRDDADCPRLVVWKDGNQIVGTGKYFSGINTPACGLSGPTHSDDFIFYGIVPLVVIYE